MMYEQGKSDGPIVPAKPSNKADDGRLDRVAPASSAADIRGFFDAIDREWLMKFVGHRIADRRIERLIRKWLNAGVLTDGVRTYSDCGTVQGGSISPLLANLYLHYAFDLWVQWWRTTRTQGDVIVVRYADDCVPRRHERRCMRVA